ncbi:MAG: hypothetical protein J2P23_14960, partial [Microlunatus sp.]|nr:hypothetical protein [Microlunatus sp.]
LTLPGAAVVGGLASLLADRGLAGTIILLVGLGIACLVIYLLSRRNAVDRTNVTDSPEVLVLNAAKPNKIAKAQRKYAKLLARQAAEHDAAQAAERQPQQLSDRGGDGA